MVASSPERIYYSAKKGMFYGIANYCVLISVNDLVKMRTQVLRSLVKSGAIGVHVYVRAKSPLNCYTCIHLFYGERETEH